MFSFNSPNAHLARSNPAEFSRGMMSHKPDLYQTRAMIQDIMNDASSLRESLNMITEQFVPKIAEGSEKLTEEMPFDIEKALHVKAPEKRGRGWTVTSTDATNPIEAWLQKSRTDLTEDEPEDEEREALFG